MILGLGNVKLFFLIIVLKFILFLFKRNLDLNCGPLGGSRLLLGLGEYH